MRDCSSEVSFPSTYAPSASGLGHRPCEFSPSVFIALRLIDRSTASCPTRPTYHSSEPLRWEIGVWLVALCSVPVYLPRFPVEYEDDSRLPSACRLARTSITFYLADNRLCTINTVTALPMIFYQGQDRVGRIFRDFTQTLINRRPAELILVNKGRLK